MEISGEELSGETEKGEGLNDTMDFCQVKHTMYSTVLINPDFDLRHRVRFSSERKRT